MGIFNDFWISSSGIYVTSTLMAGHNELLFEFSEPLSSTKFSIDKLYFKGTSEFEGFVGQTL